MLCAGCVKCRPLDADDRGAQPHQLDGSPSSAGAWVVRAEDYDALAAELRGLRHDIEYALARPMRAAALRGGSPS